MQLRDITATVLTSIVLLGGGMTHTAIAYERFGFDQRYLIQPGFIIKDHNVVEKDGVFHIFYIKADETVSVGETAKSLGHATSTDLTHWTFHPDVVYAVPGTWEEAFIWAPHIVEQQGTYYMFYTGVNWSYSQAIGLATSQDLFEWTKVGTAPVYTPDPSWAKWDTTSWSNCRDPFVFSDEGQWHLLTTAQTIDLKGAISHATSTDLVNWQDQGPLFVHPGPKAWHVLESTNLHIRYDKYFLFFTEEQVAGTFCLNAPSLNGPWVYADRQLLDLGHAAELTNIRGNWLLSRHDAFTFDNKSVFVIKFDDLEWKNNRDLIVTPSSPMDAWRVLSGTAFTEQPIFWDNAFARGEAPANFDGNSWIGSMEHYGGPLRFGEPGGVIGNEATGAIRSPIFRISGNRITFRIGGTQDINNTFLALYRARDGLLIAKSTGNGIETMSDAAWDLSDWYHERVYIEIVDASVTGHINVDEIMEAYDPIAKSTLAANSSLDPNVPNPFNPTTRISFETDRAGAVTLMVFDVRGCLVQRLLDGELEAGRHEVIWNGRYADGSLAPSGTYFCRLQLDSETFTRSMRLLK